MTSFLSLSPRGKKLAAVALACAVLVGLSGCNNRSVLNSASGVSASSSSSQRDLDRIYANHTEGADPDGGYKDYKSREEFRKRVAVLNKWGVKQTSDWLAICNQVNVQAMREVGFDPQKDLLNRFGGAEKNNCYWSQDNWRLQFFLGKTDSVDRIKSEPKFNYSSTVHRNGEIYYMGHIRFFGGGTTINQYDCSLAFERDDDAYMAAFTGKDPKTHDEACNELIEMVSPRK